MLPTHLSSSIMRYKSETDYFINWLAWTAIGRGFKFSSACQPSLASPTAAKGPRLKGKARKLAREQEAASSAQSPAKKVKCLTTTELLDCANKIVNGKAALLLVPHTIYGSLLKAIELRNKCSSWFNEQEQCSSNENLKRSNSTHRFFNATLESVRALLEPFAEPRPKRETSSGSKTRSSQNKFDPLKDTTSSAEDDHEEQDVPFPRLVSFGGGKAEETVFEVENTDDALMAIYCLLQDFLELRLTVRSSWHTLVHDVSVYSDLITAAMLTQGAFEIIPMLVQTFNEQFPDLTSMEEIMVLLLGSSPHPNQQPLSAEVPDTTSSVSRNTTQEQLADLLQRTYLETFRSAKTASAGPAASLTTQGLYEMTDEVLEMIREGRQSATPMFALECNLRYLKTIREASWVDQETLLPDSDSFTRFWYDATKTTAGCLKPGLEQVLVTQLYLDVKVVLHRKGDLCQQHIDSLFRFLSELELTDLERRHQPRPEFLPEPTLAAYPYTRYPSSDIPGPAMTGMNAYINTNPIWAGLRMMYRIVGLHFEELDSPSTQNGPVALAHVQE